MDRHEADVVVEASKDGTYIVLLEVRASGREKVRATDHSVRESISGEAHSNGSHFSENKGGAVKFFTPLVHLGSPVREIGWDGGRVVIRGVFRPLSDLPQESPLSVVDGCHGGHGLLRFW